MLGHKLNKITFYRRKINSYLTRLFGKQLNNGRLDSAAMNNWLDINKLLNNWLFSNKESWIIKTADLTTQISTVVSSSMIS